MHHLEKLIFRTLGMAFLAFVFSAPSVTFASACDIPGECKGVVEEVTLPPAPATPTSATGCWIPGRTNCSMVAGSCVCDPLPPAAEEELGYLCITSDPCMNAEIVIVNGAKTCSVTKKEGCGDNGTTAPKPATPPPSETPSEDTDPTKPATPVNTPPAGVPPVTVPPVVPTDDWCDELPTAYRDCCRETKGSPIDVMKTCVQEETRDADCNIVINVMGDFILGDKAQMNLCCQVVSNSGIIDDSSIVQECKNAFDGTPVDTSTPSEPAATPGDTTSTDDCADGIIVLGKCQPKDFVHLQGGGDGSGCALTAGASGSSDMSWLSLMLLGASLLGLKRFRDHA